MQKRGYLVLVILLVGILLNINYVDAASTTCNSCADCATKINSGSYDTVELANDITYTPGGPTGSVCINIDNLDIVTYPNSYKTLDCKGFKINGNGQLATGVNIKSKTTIKNCNINGFSASNAAGIRFFYDYPSYNIITNNVIENNYLGIYLSGSDLNTISNNQIKNNRIGITMSTQSSFNTISDNDQIEVPNTAGAVGLGVYGSDHQILRNTITSSKSAIKLQTNTQRIDIKDNTINMQSGDNAIELTTTSIYDILIDNNIITYASPASSASCAISTTCGAGIYSADSNDITITKNRIHNGRPGIFITNRRNARIQQNTITSDPGYSTGIKYFVDRGATEGTSDIIEYNNLNNLYGPSGNNIKNFLIQYTIALDPDNYPNYNINLEKNHWGVSDYNGIKDTIDNPSNNNGETAVVSFCPWLMNLFPDTTLYTGNCVPQSPQPNPTPTILALECSIDGTNWVTCNNMKQPNNLAAVRAKCVDSDVASVNFLLSSPTNPTLVNNLPFTSSDLVNHYYTYDINPDHPLESGIYTLTATCTDAISQSAQETVSWNAAICTVTRASWYDDGNEYPYPPESPAMLNDNQQITLKVTYDESTCSIGETVNLKVYDSANQNLVTDLGDFSILSNPITTTWITEYDPSRSNDYLFKAEVITNPPPIVPKRSQIIQVSSQQQIAYCGNGVLDSGEDCDPGSQATGDTICQAIEASYKCIPLGFSGECSCGQFSSQDNIVAITRYTSCIEDSNTQDNLGKRDKISERFDASNGQPVPGFPKTENIQCLLPTQIRIPFFSLFNIVSVIALLFIFYIFVNRKNKK